MNPGNALGTFSNPLIYHIGSGQAYFVGIGLVVLALIISILATSRWFLLVRNLLVFLGWIWTIISATPLPYWLYGLLGSVSGTWLVIEWLGERAGKNSVRNARLLLAGASVLAVAVELPYHFTPSLPALDHPALFVIGDSVSAGVEQQKTPTWPHILAESKGWKVHNLAQMGATVKTALAQAGELNDADGLILLEIGGNDLLGAGPPENYRPGLEKLLAAVCRPGRTVLMMELPLPPFANEFGRTQRELAKKFRVPLIPKRAFVTVLTTAGATLDGIHLSPSGHELMADTLGEILGQAFGE